MGILLVNMLVKFLVILIILLSIFVLYWFGFFNKPSDEREELIVHDTIFKLDIADTSQLITKGLGERESLADNEGMWFIFNNSKVRTFWMKGMLIPIDIIWINEDRVIGFEENVQPEPGVSIMKLKKYVSPGPADRVLEVNAGTVERIGIAVHDRALVR